MQTIQVLIAASFEEGEAIRDVLFEACSGRPLAGR